MRTRWRKAGVERLLSHRSKTLSFRLVWNELHTPALPLDIRVSLLYARPRVQLYPVPHSLVPSLTFPDRRRQVILVNITANSKVQ
jgi:hypothetical protein